MKNALQQAQANVSTARAQYDLMMAGYRAEEIAQAAAAVNQAQAARVYAQNFFINVSSACAPAARFPPTTSKTPVLHAIRRRRP